MITLKIFIASPGDVDEERDIVSQVVVPEVRRIFSEELFGSNGTIDVEAVRWETHVLPDVGEDAQDVVNSQISDFDILVGMMWKRFGTPTKRAASGTGEEFERAYNLFKRFNKPKIMFYFRTTPFYTTDIKDLTQFRKVLDFRKKLRDLGVVFFDYNSPIDFERKVREHLIRQVSRIAQTNGGTEVQEEQLQIKGEQKAVEETTAQDVQITGIVGGGVIEVQTYGSRKPNLFLSYVREDSEKVRNLYSVLRSVGLDPWLDVENLFPGQDWDLEISKAISKADFILIFLSNWSTNKRGYFQKELKFALDILMEKPTSDIFVIPVRLEETPVPEPLRHLQWVDLFRDGGVELLVKSINVAWKNKYGLNKR